MNKLLAATFGIIALLTSAASQAYFFPAAAGARPAGMGEAFSSVSDDTNCLLYNPAGLARLPGYEFTGMYSDLYTNLGAQVYTGDQARFGYNYLAAGVPLDPFFAEASGATESANQPAEQLYGSLGVAWLQFNTAFYQENTFILGYGATLDLPLLKDYGVVVRAGASLKSLQWHVGSNSYIDDPAYFPSPERGKSGFTADAGLMVGINGWINLGASVENAVPVDMGLTEEEKIPQVYRLGVAGRVDAPIKYVDSLQLALEGMLRDDHTSRLITPKIGAEAWLLKNSLAVRLGYNLDQISTGFSLRRSWFDTPFVGQLDYAFAWPLAVAGTYGSHRVGFTLEWDLALAKQLQEKNAHDEVIKSNIDIKKKQEEAERLRRLIEETEHRKTYWIEIDSKVQTAEKAVQDARASIHRIQDSATETATLYSDPARQAAVRLAANSRKSLREAESALVNAKSELDKFDGKRKTIHLIDAQVCDQTVVPWTNSAEARAQDILRTEALVEQAKYLTSERSLQSIVIGVDEAVFSDYSETPEYRKAVTAFQNWLGRQVSLPLEIRALPQDQLVQEFRRGGIDLLLSGNPYFQPFVQEHKLVRELTIKRDGEIFEHCCLLVRKDCPCTKPEQLRNKRLAYISPVVLDELKNLYGSDPTFEGLNYFQDVTKCKNGVDALMKLQLNQADAVFDYVSLKYLYEKHSIHMTNGIRILKTGKAFPFLALLSRPSNDTNKKNQIHSLLQSLKKSNQIPEAKPLLDYFRIERILDWPATETDTPQSKGKHQPKEKST
jgi:hypothetical protein